MSVSVTAASSGIEIQTATPRLTAKGTPSVQELARPSTVVSISKAFTENATQTADTDTELEKPSATLQMLDGQTQMDNYYSEFREYVHGPKDAASNSLRRASAELVRLQDRIEASRPAMLGKRWDFVLKDGKLEVINDNLSAKDRQWLENTLNRNQKLVSSVQGFYDAVTKYYENTKEHGLPTVRDSTGYEAGWVVGAAEQINGKLAVRDIMDRTIASLLHPNAFLSADTRKPFQNSIELVTGYFKVLDSPKYRTMKYDLSEPGTAQYFKEHPDELYK